MMATDQRWRLMMCRDVWVSRDTHRIWNGLLLNKTLGDSTFCRYKCLFTFFFSWEGNFRFCWYFFCAFLFIDLKEYYLPLWNAAYLWSAFWKRLLHISSFLCETEFQCRRFVKECEVRRAVTKYRGTKRLEVKIVSYL